MSMRGTNYKNCDENHRLSGHYGVNRVMIPQTLKLKTPKGK